MCAPSTIQKKSPGSAVTRAGVAKSLDISAMFNLSNSSASYNSNVTAPSTGADHAGWRGWWQAQANRQGSDWSSVIGLHLTIVDQLRDADAADAQVGCSS